MTPLPRQILLALLFLLSISFVGCVSKSRHEAELISEMRRSWALGRLEGFRSGYELGEEASYKKGFLDGIFRCEE